MQLQFVPYQFPTQQDYPSLYEFPNKGFAVIEHEVQNRLEWRNQCKAERQRDYAERLRDAQRAFQQDLAEIEYAAYQDIEEIYCKAG